jgi:hypothetical protein
MKNSFSNMVWKRNKKKSVVLISFVIMLESSSCASRESCNPWTRKPLTSTNNDDEKKESSNNHTIYSRSQIVKTMTLEHPIQATLMWEFSVIQRRPSTFEVWAFDVRKCGGKNLVIKQWLFKETSDSTLAMEWMIYGMKMCRKKWAYDVWNANVPLPDDPDTVRTQKRRVSYSLKPIRI